MLDLSTTTFWFEDLWAFLPIYSHHELADETFKGTMHDTLMIYLVQIFMQGNVLNDIYLFLKNKSGWHHNQIILNNFGNRIFLRINLRVLTQFCSRLTNIYSILSNSSLQHHLLASFCTNLLPVLPIFPRMYLGF